jgi:hypothetical protein
MVIPGPIPNKTIGLAITRAALKSEVKDLRG